MIYYVNMMANVEDKTMNIIVDVEAKNGAAAIVKVIESLNNPEGSIESISIICHADPEGACK